MKGSKPSTLHATFSMVEGTLRYDKVTIHSRTRLTWFCFRISITLSPIRRLAFCAMIFASWSLRVLTSSCLSVSIPSMDAMELFCTADLPAKPLPRLLLCWSEIIVLFDFGGWLLAVRRVKTSSMRASIPPWAVTWKICHHQSQAKLQNNYTWYVRYTHNNEL